MRNKLIMKYPASWHGDMWREAVPVGNGEIGALIYGGVWKEIISLIHGKLWTGAQTQTLPDVSGVLPQMRKFLNENKPLEAEFIMHDELKRLGYYPKIGRPLPVCDSGKLSRKGDEYRRACGTCGVLQTGRQAGIERHAGGVHACPARACRRQRVFRCQPAGLRLPFLLWRADVLSAGGYGAFGRASGNARRGRAVSVAHRA